MIPAAIIAAALSILSGDMNQIDLDKALGENKEEIFQQVQSLKGTRLTQIKETIDILASYKLDIERGNLILANNEQAEGVAYSTDPPEDQRIV